MRRIGGHNAIAPIADFLDRDVIRCDLSSAIDVVNANLGASNSIAGNKLRHLYKTRGLD